MLTLKSPREIEKMKIAGRIVAELDGPVFVDVGLVVGGEERREVFGDGRVGGVREAELLEAGAAGGGFLR